MKQNIRYFYHADDGQTTTLHPADFSTGAVQCGHVLTPSLSISSLFLDSSELCREV
jgi:hypothetical protein